MFDDVNVKYRFGQEPDRKYDVFYFPMAAKLSSSQLAQSRLQAVQKGYLAWHRSAIPEVPEVGRDLNAKAPQKRRAFVTVGLKLLKARVPAWAGLSAQTLVKR
jgi:hypothetical protein